MSARTSISKKIRFEIFKRDKFTCQYCGRKSPDIVLNIDHIKPIAGGGDNDILNLITSCFDCNNGKRAKSLDDNSVIEKQRKQLELLQERREQMEFMLEWQKSLTNFDMEASSVLIKHVEEIIKPHSLNDGGKEIISIICKKYTNAQIITNIDETYKKYIIYDENGATLQSAELFLKELPKLLGRLNKAPIENKIAYIIGIGRNRFSNWNTQVGAIILNNYVKALKNHGYSDEQILNDLETEIIQKTKTVDNWQEWKDLLESWTDDIKKWNTNKQPQINDTRIHSDEIVDGVGGSRFMANEAKISFLLHLATLFPNFNEDDDIKKIIYKSIDNILSTATEMYKLKGRLLKEDELVFIDQLILDSEIHEYFYSTLRGGYDDTVSSIYDRYMLCYASGNIISHILKDIWLELLQTSSRLNYDTTLKYFEYYLKRYNSYIMI